MVARAQPYILPPYLVSYYHFQPEPNLIMEPIMDVKCNLFFMLTSSFFFFACPTVTGYDSSETIGIASILSLPL